MKHIIVKMGSVKEHYRSKWILTYYVVFPSEELHVHIIKTTEEGFLHTAALWNEAGYEVVFEENDQL